MAAFRCMGGVEHDVVPTDDIGRNLPRVTIVTIEFRFLLSFGFDLSIAGDCLVDLGDLRLFLEMFIDLFEIFSSFFLE